jgi:hypothetical protein
VDYSIDRVLAKETIERGPVPDVTFHERRARSANLLDPIDDDRRTVAEIVEQDRLEPGVDKFDACV